MENPEGDCEIYVQEVKFICGLHVADRQRNHKELIERCDESVNIALSKPGEIGLEFYMSKAPMKFQDMPLAIAIDMHFKSQTKLNVSRQGVSLIEGDELLLPEFHQIRFEGVIDKNYTNCIKDVVKMRNLYRRQAKRLSEGLMPDCIKDWYITNLDGRVSL